MKKVLKLLCSLTCDLYFHCTHTAIFQKCLSICSIALIKKNQRIIKLEVFSFYSFLTVNQTLLHFINTQMDQTSVKKSFPNRTESQQICLSGNLK